jgi:uncharacterized membrane protein YeaQ/YmgE (transglycosylase-associated protein family)
MNFKETPVLIGTAGGTIASTLPNVGVEHIITTCILGLLGATVSFIMTLLLKKMVAILKKIQFFGYFSRKKDED